MLSFSHDDIIFNYKPNSHLTTKLTIKNNSSAYAYFKFKVSRQKLFMVKPDRGVIKPKQQMEISFTLHKDGVEDSADDKFHFISVFDEKLRMDDINSLFKAGVQTEQKKFMVKVLGAGDLIKSTNPQSKTLYNSINPKDFQSARKSLIEDNLSIEALIEKKQKRIEELEKQIQQFKMEKISGSSGEKKKSGKKGKIILALIGFSLGMLTGFYI